jgi:uridine kinase
MAELAAFVCATDLPHPTRVAVDGITAAGKSTLAAELAAAVADRGRQAVHLTMDGFHHRREHRYRQGRMSGPGYYDDAYDFDALVAEVLRPLGPGGDRRYRRRVLDLASDVPVADEPWVEADLDAVLVVDGSFLQRPGVAYHWDVPIFVDTSFATALARGIGRDADDLGGPAAAEKADIERYLAAGRLYVESVHPAEQAAVIVDNEDPAHPALAFRGTR